MRAYRAGLVNHPIAACPDTSAKYWHMIHVGSVLGGSSPSVDRVNSFITELSFVVEDLRAKREYDFEVDVVFLVPGSRLEPDFTGVRAGSLSKAQCIVQVQIAVPDQHWEARELRSFLRGSLVRALDVAGERIESRKLDWDTTDFADVVASAGRLPESDWDIEPDL